MRHTLQSFFIVLLILLSATGAAADPAIRVLISEAASEAAVKGQGATAHDRRGRVFRLNEEAVFSAAGERALRIKGVKGRLPDPVIVSAASGDLRLNGKTYRGHIELSAAGGGGLDVINITDLEDYTWGVTAAEMPSSWPMDALKAQAVAARTYAVWKMLNSDQAYHVRATVMDQVFSGIPTSATRAFTAVKETKGLVLTHNGAPILAYYHACCGGATDSAASIKGISRPYLAPARCLWCRDCPHHSWEHRAAVAKVGDQLSAGGGNLPCVDRLVPIKRTPGGRVSALHASGAGKRLTISGERLREALGYGALKSARFTVAKRGRTFRFSGKGYGHGLGACQWGMKGLAEKGYTWARILSHYYKNVKIAQIKRRSPDSAQAAAP